jgi:membrane protease YdiL (CAAX protease family)
MAGIFISLLVIFLFRNYNQPTLAEGYGYVKVPVGHVNLIIVIISNIINAYWEELTCIAYAFNQFATKFGPLFALIVTVLLRVGCHTYQGSLPLVGIAIVFFLFGVCYWFTRSLWPLILAHFLFDTIQNGFK